MREESANACGGGAGIFTHCGSSDALSVVRDEGARAVAMVGGAIACTQHLGVALEAMEKRHGTRGDATRGFDDEDEDGVLLAEGVGIVLAFGRPPKDR